MFLGELIEKEIGHTGGDDHQTTVLKDDNNYNSEHGLQGNMYPSQSGTSYR